MYIRKIAVVSSNPQILRFFALECQLLGYAVDRFSKMPFEPKKYTHIFVDTDTVRYDGIESGTVFSVSQSTMQKSGDRHLQWPISFVELREILDGAHDLVAEDSPPKDDSVLWIGSRERHEIRYETQSVILSQGEFLLFDALAIAQKKPVSRAALMCLFGAETGNIVDVYICLLRKKLEQICDRRVIITERGVGYRLTMSVKDVEKKK